MDNPECACRGTPGRSLGLLGKFICTKKWHCLIYIYKKIPNQDVYSRLKGYLWAFVFMGQEANILAWPVHYQPLTMLSD